MAVTAGVTHVGGVEPAAESDLDRPPRRHAGPRGTVRTAMAVVDFEECRRRRQSAVLSQRSSAVALNVGDGGDQRLLGSTGRAVDDEPLA